MTREEIRERAEKLMAEEDIARYDDDNEIGVVERHLLALARATLEEAARVVCGDCADGVQLLPQTAEWEYGHPDYDGYRYDCAAAPIYDLIAALDKEDDHE